MNGKQNPAPGFRRHPDHSITVEHLGAPVTVTEGGVVLARSGHSLLLREMSYPPVIYIPFADIDFGQLERSATATHCPFKGDASYWRLAGHVDGADVMWAYETPFDEMTAIRAHGAFHRDRVTLTTG